MKITGSFVMNVNLEASIV